MAHKDTVEVQEYKNYKINIYADECTESPDDWGDDGLFLVGYHRDFTVDRGKRSKDGRHVPGISEGLAQCIARGGKYEDGSRNDEAREYCKKYHIFGLEAYIHSGVALHLSGGCAVDREWDVSQVGLVFVAKTETRTRKKAEVLARGLLETWNDYLSGSVYGYMIENADGDESGGCWSFYGYDYEKSGLLEAAREEIDAQLIEDKKIDRIAAGAMA